MFVQLRDTQLDPQLGILEGSQYIAFDKSKLTDRLVRLAEAIGDWHRVRDVRLFLLPEQFAAAVTPHLQATGFYVQYSLYDRLNNREGPIKTNIVRTAGGLSIVVKGLPTDKLLQVEAGFNGGMWTSAAVDVEVNNIIMTPLV
jgi:hypothetical protein